MKDLPISLKHGSSYDRLTVTGDIATYSENLQRVIVYMLTHIQIGADGERYTGLDIARRYTTGSVAALVDALDKIASNFLRQELKENTNYIDKITVSANLLGRNIIITVNVTLADGSTDSGDISING